MAHAGGLTAAATAGAVVVEGLVPLLVFLLLGGMAAASASSASGRLVVGWFPTKRRGLAMGIRQMAQPLGVAAAALVVPPLSQSGGIAAAFVPTLIVAAGPTVLCAVGLRNPPRPALTGRADGTPAATGNPYRGDSFLVRVHAVSALFVVPQFTVTTFGLVWLVAASASGC